MTNLNTQLENTEFKTKSTNEFYGKYFLTLIKSTVGFIINYICWLVLDNSFMDILFVINSVILVGVTLMVLEILSAKYWEDSRIFTFIVKVGKKVNEISKPKVYFIVVPLFLLAVAHGVLNLLALYFWIF